MKFVEDFFRESYTDISDETLQAILEGIEVKDYKKGETVIHEGVIPECFYIIKSGFIRSYFKGKKESTIIKGFYTDNEMFSPMVALFKNEVNYNIFDCLQDSKIVEINYKKFREITKHDIGVAFSYIKSLEKTILINESRIRNLMSLDATERYLKLLEYFPKIELLIAQYHIASYLNITPVQLSRIKRKLIEEDRNK